MKDWEEIHYQKEAKVLLGQDLFYLWDGGGPGEIQFTFWEKVFLGAPFKLETPPVIHASVKAGSSKDDKDNSNGLKTEQYFHVIRDKATEKDACRSYQCSHLVNLISWNRLPCLVKTSAHRAHFACWVKVSMLWKAHDDTIRWSPLSQSPSW